MTRAIERGFAFLAASQGQDGALRSRTYGILKPGYSLTALYLYVLSLAPVVVRERHRAAIDRGLAFLANGVRENGAIGVGGIVTDYPAYSSSFYLLALCRLQPSGWRRRAEQQVAYLRSIQMTAQHGWPRTHLAFGGFAFGGKTPKHPNGAADANVSVAAFAIAALRAAGVPADDRCIEDACRFIERCERGRGFVFTWSGPMSEKAGRLPSGAARAYGTATCDALRALALGGRERSEAFRRGKSWLEESIDANDRSPLHVPGKWPGDTARMRDSMSYYWLATAALTREVLGLAAAARESKALLDEQRSDGSWQNGEQLMKEDDPVLATLLALIAACVSVSIG